MPNSLDRSYGGRHLSASSKAESETDNFTRFSMGEQLAVKRPKSLAVRRKNWQILTNSCKNKLTVRKKQSSGDNNGMV